MSASREKRTRQQLLDQGLSEKEIKIRLADQKKGGKRTAYTILGVVLAVLALGLVVWNTGIIQSRAVAVTIDGKDYTTGYLSYYYQQVKGNELYNAYSGMSLYNPAVDADKQVYNETDGTTYHDYFLQTALEEMQLMAGVRKQADAAGHTLSETAQQQRADTLAQLALQAKGNGHRSMDSYLKVQYGKYMSSAIFEDILDTQLIVSDHSQAYIEGMEYTDSEIQTYYNEHRDELDNFQLSYMVFRANVPVETDEAGNEIKRTEEETAAALQKAKDEQKAKAETAQQKLAAGATIAELELELELEPYGAYADQTVVGASVNTSFSQWAYDPTRKAGDITLAEYDGTTFYNYYVVRFQDRQRDNSGTANVRHALIAADNAQEGTAPGDAEYAAAKAEAEKLLADWKAAGSTEADFATLAQENSADPGSASNGGLISNISANSGYVETFSDWALDPARKVGDTGIVQNTGSSTKGWHIMYFQSWGEPVWKLTVENTLMDADFTAWSEAAQTSVTMTQGSGAGYVK